MSTLRTTLCVQCAHGDIAELRSDLLEMFCVWLGVDTSRCSRTEAVSEPEMPGAILKAAAIRNSVSLY